MKRLFSLFCTLLMLCSGGIVLASSSPEYDHMDRLNESINGAWCEQNGHRPVVFAYDQLNEMRITDASNFTGDKFNGSATLTVLAKEGTKFYNIYWDNTAGKRVINLDGVLRLYPKTGEINHAESVGGLTLDMTMAEVDRRYSGDARMMTPSETKAMCGVNDIGWYFKDIGLIVTYDDYTFTVDRLIILNGAKTAFDRSVLNADSPLYRYAEVYGWSYTPELGSVVDMGNGESMSFKYYPQAVMLKLNDVQ